jgi:hypothetical protein
VSTLERPPKGRLFGVGRRARQNIRCITRKELTAFLLGAENTGLANLAAGTTEFKAPETIISKQEYRRKLHVGSARALRLFDRAWAFSADLLAVHKMLFLVLTLMKNERITDWNARVEAAGELGDAGLREMLMASLDPGVEVQTPMAFERLLDYFVGGLGPGKRRNASESMFHTMNTLPIFSPEDERELKTKGCIMKPGGALNRPGQPPIHCPDISFVLQPGKGIGIRAEQDIAPDAVIGANAGVEVMNSEIGRPYVSLTYPSRFVAVVTGNIPELNLGQTPRFPWMGS